MFGSHTHCRVVVVVVSGNTGCAFVPPAVQGVKSGPVEPPQEGDCSLVKTEPSVKTRKTRAEEPAPVRTG